MLDSATILDDTLHFVPFFSALRLPSSGHVRTDSQSITYHRDQGERAVRQGGNMAPIGSGYGATEEEFWTRLQSAIKIGIGNTFPPWPICIPDIEIAGVSSGREGSGRTAAQSWRTDTALGHLKRTCIGATGAK